MKKILREIIYQNIKDDIYSGKFSPGQRLIEANLIERFKNSRTTIREALCLLECGGLVTFESNKGFSVSKISPQEVNEIYDLLCLLEGYAARLTTEISSEQIDVESLYSAQKKLEIAARKNDLNSWMINNDLFHDFFIENSGSNNLIKIIESLYQRIYRFKYIHFFLRGHFNDYIQQHEMILKNFKAKNSETVEKLMKTHLRDVKEVLIDYLSKYQG